MTDQSSQGLIYREQSLIATVNRACRVCEAPGTWSSEHRIKRGWVGCYVDEDDERVGQPVGPMCPHCGSDRTPQQQVSLGRIWHKIFSKG
jgi:hypothetical protein